MCRYRTQIGVPQARIWKAATAVRDIRWCTARSTWKGSTKAVLRGHPLATSRGPNLMVLRRTNDDNFKVVGEAHCNEFADGEALMGTMPDGFQLVKRWSEQVRGCLVAFLNSETGSFQAEDPRLSYVPLPLGWRKKRHGHEEWVERFINDISGEDNIFDPRLTAERLKQRGVDMRTLNIV